MNNDQIRVRSGVTLVELLISLSISAILFAISLPAIQSVREASRKTNCQNSMRQVMLALHQFEACHGRLPPTLSLDTLEVMRHWQAASIDFLEQSAIAEEMSEEFRHRIHPWYQKHSLTTIPVLQCSSNPDKGLIFPSSLGGIKFAFTDYCGVAGIRIDDEIRGVFPIDLESIADNGTRFSEIHDGLSTTICFGERPPVRTGEGYGRWLGSQTTSSASIGVFEDFESLRDANPVDCQGCSSHSTGFQPGERGSLCDWMHHWSYHPSGANFSRVDGSVFFVSYSIDKSVLESLATRDGAEPTQ